MIVVFSLFTFCAWTIFGAPLNSNTTKPIIIEPTFNRNRDCAVCTCDDSAISKNNSDYMPSKLIQSIICRECCIIIQQFNITLPQINQTIFSNLTGEDYDDDKISANALGSLLG